MKFSVEKIGGGKGRGAGLIALPLFQDKAAANVSLVEAARPYAGVVEKMIAHHGLRGKDGETMAIHAGGKGEIKFLGLVGVGKLPFGAMSARKLAANAVRLAVSAKVGRVTVCLPEMEHGTEGDVLCAAAEGAALAGYSFRKYKSSDSGAVAVREVAFLLSTNASLPAAKRGLASAEPIISATVCARDLVNEPASEMTPSRLVAEARSAVRGHKSLKLKVFDRVALKKMGARGLLAVGSGSEHPPYLLHFTYSPAGRPKARVVLVGKGLTFDSGGLSLKPSEAMEDMKIDMAGAAAVIGVMSVLPEIAPNIEVHGVAGLCENMPSGKAMRPGDVIRTMGGKTIEVMNTDAEGRITLADTLHYGARLEPDMIIDLATLTGACMVALGQEVAGLISNSDGLAEKIAEAADGAGELLWRLPLVDQYEDLIKSDVADVRNTSTTRYGGALTAGLFLRRFVGDVPWAHIDMAGPAWAERDVIPFQPKGATGFGVRTVLRFLRSF